jgi:hypothetical protein
MPLFHHDHKDDQQTLDPEAEAMLESAGPADDPGVPPGMVRSLYPEGGLEPDLIGDEWKQGTPDEAVAEPNELEWDLAEGPGALLGGSGEVDPAPVVPMPEVTHRRHEGRHR